MLWNNGGQLAGCTSHKKRDILWRQVTTDLGPDTFGPGNVWIGTEKFDIRVSGSKFGADVG